MEKRKILVKVVSASQLAPKNSNSKNNPYCIVTVLNQDGKKAKDAKTSVQKETLNPTWNETLEFSLEDNICGVKVSVWDKHKLRSDKFLGEVAIKFNLDALESETIDDKFDLNPRKSNEIVSGSISLVVSLSGSLSKSSSSIVSPRAHVKVSIKSSGSDEGENQDEGVSADQWNKDNAALKKSTYVVIKQNIDPTEKYPLPREGPHFVPLQSFGNSKVTVSKSLKVVSTTSSNIEMAVGNVKLRASKWYFECQYLTSGSSRYCGVYIGWISNLFKKWGDPSGWFVGNDGKKITQNNAEDYMPCHWAAGDVVGCSLDLEKGNLQYYLNGTKMNQAAFNFITRGSSKGEYFVPAFAITNSTQQQLSVNFGDEPFKHKPDGFWPIHYQLSTEQRKDIEKLFENYRNVDEENNNKNDDEAEIVPSGTIKMAIELGIDVTTSPDLLLLAWKFSCEYPVWTFSKEQFLIGWSVYGCRTLDDIKNILKKWKTETLSTFAVPDTPKSTLSESNLFYKFYKYCFHYLKEDKKVMVTSDAVLSWDLLLKPYNWKLYPVWIKFVTKKAKVINADVWEMLLPFIFEHPTSTDDYDEGGCWPTLMDDFVEFAQSEKGAAEDDD
eukprot:TRINITY_DN6353_c0_g1_i1.p1 TRINITY_DN6353_c0_g1~~TRINITY_DN6353_c0_g1_i1.p1  ORF type:complete len:610 (-),score=140.30 TRINITY_DN6353_c0_g1_i1:90-1919(-)